MDIEVTEKRDNPLLGRKEIKFSIRYEGPTPKFAEARKAVAEKLKSNEKLTIVDSIKSEFGRQKLTGYAKVYENEAALKAETAPKLSKNLEGKKKKKMLVGGAEGGEKPAEAKKPEKAKAEEKPAEPKAAGGEKPAKDK